VTGLLGHLAHKPLQRRVTLLTVVLVSLAVVVSNLAGFVALRLTLHQEAAATTTAVAESSRPPPPARSPRRAG
jgi:two-component system sensor histidine kinase MprB